jgi:hypothetical protein
MVPLTLSHLVVRWLHLLAMAVALGGTALAWGVSRVGPQSAALAVAGVYESAFWGAVGVLVMTGVGNLGALAPAIPRGTWGAVLLAKLALVLVVLLGSAVRTASVWATRGTPDAGTAPLERGYALTTVALVAVVALAEVLAHG